MLLVIFLVTVLIVVAWFLAARYFRQKIIVNGTVHTPNQYHAITSGDDDRYQYVLITFRPAGGQPVTIEHYYSKSSYKSPQDFARLHKTVTVRYNPDDTSNYTILEESKGDYTTAIASILLGAFIGSLTVSSSDGGLFDKVKVFFITFLSVAAGVYVLSRLKSYFSFLNILTSRNED